MPFSLCKKPKQKKNKAKQRINCQGEISNPTGISGVLLNSKSLLGYQER